MRVEVAGKLFGSIYGSRDSLFNYLLAYGAPQMNAVFSASMCSKRAPHTFCSGGGVEIGLAIKTKLSFSEKQICFQRHRREARAVCKLYCGESFLWWDFMELIEVSKHLLDIILFFLENGFDLLVRLLRIR